MHKVRSRLIIVVVHAGAVKIYVAAVEALRKEKGKTGSKLSVLVPFFSDFTENSNVSMSTHMRSFF
jgi:hypothetical protein